MITRILETYRFGRATLLVGSLGLIALTVDKLPSIIWPSSEPELPYSAAVLERDAPAAIEADKTRLDVTAVEVRTAPPEIVRKALLPPEAQPETSDNEAVAVFDPAATPAPPTPDRLDLLKDDPVTTLADVGTETEIGMTGETDGAIAIAQLILPQSRTEDGVLAMLRQGVAVLEIDSDSGIFLVTADPNTVRMSELIPQRLKARSHDPRSRVRVQLRMAGPIPAGTFGFAFSRQGLSPRITGIDLVLTEQALAEILIAQNSFLAGDPDRPDASKMRMTVCFEESHAVLHDISPVSAPQSALRCG